MKNRKIKNEILRLRALNKSYKEISKILACSLSVISYHCGAGQKEKNLKRTRKYRQKDHPYKRKTERFILKKAKLSNKKQTKETAKRTIYVKIRRFCSNSKRGENMKSNPTFTFSDVIEKFGENPICYLTGEPIDISKSRSYHFDHMVPSSRGGTNDISNLGICTKEANLAKHNMTYDEFIDFCYKVIKYYETN